MSLESADSILHCVVNDVLHLQFIFMVCVSVREMPELLSQAETVLYMFWRHKVFCDFDATVQVVNLVRGSGRYEDSIT